MKTSIKIISCIIILLLNQQISALFHYRTDTRIPSGHDPQLTTQFLTTEGLYIILRDFVESCPQPQGFCETLNPTLPASNEDLCGPGAINTVLWKIEIKFTSTSESIYEIVMDNIFQQGIFTFALFIDGKPAPFPGLPDQNTNPAEIRFINEFFPGHHTIQIYGAEDITGGSKDLNIRFSYDFGPENILNIHDGICAAPKPKLIAQIETRKLPGCIEEEFNPRLFGKYIVHEFEKAFSFNDLTAVGGYCTFVNSVPPFNHIQTCEGQDPGGFFATGSNSRIFWLFNIQFNLNEPQTITFRYGVKFENGYALFVDEMFDQASKDPIDWDQSFDNVDQIITVTRRFRKGYHEVKLYGREFGQTRPVSIEFQPQGGTFMILDNTNWDNAFSSFQRLRVNTRRFDIPPFEGQKGAGVYPDQLEDIFDATPLKDIKYCKTNQVKFPFYNNFACIQGTSKDLLYKIEFTIQEDKDAMYKIFLSGNFKLGALVFVDGQLIQSLPAQANWDRKRGRFHRFRPFYKHIQRDRHLQIKVTTQQGGQKIHKVKIFAAEFQGGKVEAFFSRNNGVLQSIDQINKRIHYDNNCLNN